MLRLRQIPKFVEMNRIQICYKTNKFQIKNRFNNEINFFSKN